MTLSGTLVRPYITRRSVISYQTPATQPGETFEQVCFSGRASEFAFTTTRQLAAGATETVTRAMADSRLLSKHVVANHQSVATEVTASAASFPNLTQTAPVATAPNVAITTAATSVGGGYSDFCLDSRSDSNAGPLYPIIYETSQGPDASESEMSCMTTQSSFLGPFQSDSPFPALRPLAPSLHFWAYDLGDYAYDDLSYFSSHLNFPAARPIRYIIEDTSWGQEFLNDGAYFRIRLGGMNENNGPPNTAPAQNIGSLAHEFGHANHDAYDLPSGATAALKEGFADHNCIRYWLYRGREVRIWDQLDVDYSLGPLTPARGRDNRTGSGYRYGEAAAMLYDSSPAAPPAEDRRLEYPSYYYQPGLLGQPCSDENDNSTKYRCGSILSKVFWTLAHNQIRVPIHATLTALAEGDPILLTASSRAQEFAQRAYTFAISSMGGGATVGDFLASVQTYYTERSAAGEISSTELARINSVFATHCAGSYSATCEELFVSPGHYIPQDFTRKALFADGVHRLFRGDIGMGSNGEEHFIAIDNMTPSGDAHLKEERGSEVIELRSPGAAVEKTIYFPTAGCYHVEMLGRSNSHAQVRFQIDQSYLDTTFPSPVGWSWQPSQDLLVYASGNETIRVEHVSGGSLDLNALVVSKSGNLPPSATDDDNDCVDNVQDRCNGGDDTILDPDRDGLCGAIDTCPGVYDPTNRDSDNDNVGDMCETCYLDPSSTSGVDSDFDGWCDANDNCPTKSNPLQKDTDGDGIGDRCEPDFDNDGVINDDDNCPLQQNPPPGVVRI